MKVQLSSPPTNIIQKVRVGNEEVEYQFPYQYLTWLNSVFNRVGSGPFLIQGYSVTDLPDPSEYGSTGEDSFSSLIFVSDETNGPTMAFSNGVNWLRLSDNQIVSQVKYDNY